MTQAFACNIILIQANTCVKSFLQVYTFIFSTPMLYLQAKGGVLMSVGDNIRRFRKEKGWTQAKLAEELQVSQQMIGQFENSKKPPKLETAEKIAAALGVTVFDLMGGEYWDKKYPDLAKKSKEHEGFIDYLNSLGYIVKDIFFSTQIPVEEFEKSGKADLIPEGYNESVPAEGHYLELSKDGKTFIIEDDEFSNMLKDTKDLIAWRLWQKSQEQK